MNSVRPLAEIPLSSISPRRRPRIGVAGVGVVTVAVALVVPILLVSPAWRFTLATALIYAVAASSVNVMLGMAGLVGLFVAAFMGLGAYIGAASALGGGTPWVLACLAGAGAAAALGALAGLLATRLPGLSFGILTLALAAGVETVVFHEGFLGIDPALGATLNRPALAGLNVNDDRVFYFFVLIVGVLVWAVIGLHSRSRPGRAWRAIRDDELAAVAIGVRVGLHKMWAAALAGAIAGTAGVLLLTLQGQTNADPFTPFQSLLIFAAAVTAGVRSIVGAVLAGALLIVLPQLLSEAGISQRVVPLLFAAGVLVVLRRGIGLADAIVARRPQGDAA